MRSQPQQNYTLIPIDSMNKYYSKYTLQTRLLQLSKQAKFVICVYNHQMCFWYLLKYFLFIFKLIKNKFKTKNSCKKLAIWKYFRTLFQATFFKLLLIFFRNSNWLHYNPDVLIGYIAWDCQIYYLTDIRAPR